jgi:predicted metal-binding protein
MDKSRPIITIRPRRAAPILVCKKCLARADEGKKFKRALKSEIKRRNGAGPLKPPRVVMTNCLGICPKHAVVLANGTTLQRGEYVLVSDYNAIPDAARLLMPPHKV